MRGPSNLSLSCFPIHVTTVLSLVSGNCTNVLFWRQYSGSIPFTLLLLVNHCPLPCLRGILTLGGSLCWGILTLGGSLSFTLFEGNIDSWRITVLLGSASFTLVEGNRYSRRISVLYPCIGESLLRLRLLYPG